MSDYLVPLLILILLIEIGWALRRRPMPVRWHDYALPAVLDTLEDALMMFDQGGRPIYLNRTARAWFGLDEAQSYDIHSLRTHISPVDDFFALLAQSGRTVLKIGSRQVEAVSQRVAVQGVDQVTVVLHDVTASQALLAAERRRVRELAVFNEINQALHASLNLDELLETILNKLRPLFPYTSAAISLWNSAAEQLVVRGCAGPMVRVGDVLPSDAGYAAHIVREREPLLLGDTSQQPDWGHNLSLRSYVGVPLLADTNFIGILELFSDQVEGFSQATLDTLRVVASQAAVVIENARLYSETLVRADEMATFSTLAAAINASLNPDELLEIIVYSVGHVIGCDRVAIFIMDNERGVLNLAKSRGLSQEYIRASQHLRPTPDSRALVVLDRYPLVVSDIRHRADLAHLVPAVEREGFVSLADFPLRGREHVLGVLTVYYDQPHTFDRSELERLTILANQVTTALENARLYERTDRALARRVDQLAAIEEIGRELTSTLDLTRVFNLVLQRAVGSTGASAGLLALCDPACTELELIAERGYPPGALQPYWEGGWPSQRGIIGRVARSGEAALVNDVRSDPDYVSYLQTTCAQLAVPVVKEGHVLGVVSLESGRSQGFSPDDERFTSQLAELAAIAIDNARLFQQVREGRDNLQAILDSIHEGILVLDRDARVVLANPMIEQMSGLSAQALVGRRFGQVVAELGPQAAALVGYPDGELDQAVRLLDCTSDAVTKHTFEMPGSPSYRIEQIASPVIDKDGAVVGRLIVFRDITEEYRLVQMRQDLTDMIIHDLRSPLTAVIGGVQVAGDLINASSDLQMVHHALDMANESCERLMSLVDSLLDISRLEAGQMPLKRQPLLMPQLAQSVIRQMRPLAERKLVTLQLQTISKIPPVEADSELINRVLMNLMDNALKYSPYNGTVTIRLVAREPTPCDLVESLVCCTVLDMGPGIPVDYRERIFERFAQLNSRHRGVGLGLAFCRLVIQAHSGRIWVEDNPAGQGSAFSFVLPIAPSGMLSPPSGGDR